MSQVSTAEGSIESTFESSQHAVDPRALTNFVLDFCQQKGRSITNLSLQKIVYFCHVWALITTGKPLIKHRFEAWKFGPVLQFLYRDFRAFDDRPITTRATALNRITGKRDAVPYDFDKSVVELLTPIIDFYSQIRAGDLVELTHAPGGPWDQAWNHASKVNPGMYIENDAILRYYSSSPRPFTVQ